MKLLDRVRYSSWSWAAAIGVYVVAAAGTLSLRWATGGSSEARLAGALLMSGALIVTALVMRSPAYPRWSLMAAAAVFAAGSIVPELIAPVMTPGGRAWTYEPLGMGGYGWLYLVLLGGAPVLAGPRWCHSPWAVVGASVALTAGAVAAGGVR